MIAMCRVAISKMTVSVEAISGVIISAVAMSGYMQWQCLVDTV